MTKVLVAWSAFGAAVLVLVPLMSPVLLAASVVMPLLLADRRALAAELFSFNPVTSLLLVTCAYLAVNASWSPARPSALTAVCMVMLATAVLHIGAAGFALMRPEDLSALRQGLVIGLVVGLGILCFEYATRMSAQRALEHLLTSANITAVRIHTGTWEAPLNQGMTRSLGATVLMVWIGLAALVRWSDAGKRRMLGAVLVLSTAASALLSPSATAKIGFIAGAVGTVAAFYAPRLALAALTAIWVVLCTAMVPIAQLLYKLEMYNATWIHPTGRHRIAIWGATSDWYWNAPVFGAGIASARTIDALDPAHAVSVKALGETARLNWHAHNAYLQVWYEAGAVGAVLMLLIGLMVINAIRHADAALRPLFFGAFASFALFIATGFSIWAAWYLGAIGLAAMSARLTVADFSSGARPST